MLHATDKGKSKLFERYLGKRDADSDKRKVHEEDEITSNVLGPLDFLAAAEAHRFWQRILATAGHAGFLLNEPPERIVFDLWPRRKASDTGQSIEPDAFVRMHWPENRSRILLIELKWRAPLSRDDQLHRQWLNYLDDVEREQALHLFIAPEVSAGAQAPHNIQAGGNVWQNQQGGSCLVLLSWLHIRSVLSELTKDDSPLGRWARLSDQFLNKLQIRKFGGFRHLNVNVKIPEKLPEVIFWHPFSWSRLGSLPDFPHEISAPVFFNHCQ